MAQEGKVKVNRAGIAKVARSAGIAQVVDGAVQMIASKLDVPYQTSSYTTDRQAGSITVASDAQAQDGVLTRAVSAAGLQFKAKA